MGRKITEAEIEVERTEPRNSEGLVDDGTKLKKFEDKLKYVSAIAQPMASKKLNKKIMKLVKKAKDYKTYLRYGLKDVQNRIRKGETGIVVFAGDVTPIDVMCHMPALCEENKIPYCYIPSKRDLALAVGFHNSCLMVLIREHPDYKEQYDECQNEFQNLGHIV